MESKDGDWAGRACPERPAIRDEFILFEGHSFYIRCYEYLGTAKSKRDARPIFLIHGLLLNPRRFLKTPSAVLCTRCHQKKAEPCFTFELNETFTRISRPFKVDHQRGEITLEKVGEQTRVVWISTGHVQVPLLGHLLDKMAQRQFTRAFASLLKAIDQR